jgi:hypothetical protein
MLNAAFSGLQSLQAILSEILLECRSLAEAVRRMSLRYRQWPALFVNHIRAGWPAPAAASHEAADAAAHDPGAAIPAEPAECPAEGDTDTSDATIVELVVPVPNSLLLMSLCRRVQHLSSSTGPKVKEASQAHAGCPQ